MNTEPVQGQIEERESIIKFFPSDPGEENICIGCE